MSKIVIMLCAVFYTLCVSAQKMEIGNFSSQFSESKNIVYAENVKKNNYILQIYGSVTIGKNKNYRGIGFYLTSKELPKFIEVMKDIRSKFDEWSKTAIENNVKDMTKDFKVPNYKYRTFLEVSQFSKFDRKYEFKPHFSVDKNGVPSMSWFFPVAVIGSSALLENGKYIDGPFSGGGEIRFCSIEEIDDFLKIIDPDNVLNIITNKQNAQNEAKNKKKAEEDLFK